MDLGLASDRSVGINFYVLLGNARATLGAFRLVPRDRSVRWCGRMIHPRLDVFEGLFSVGDVAPTPREPEVAL